MKTEKSILELVSLNKGLGTTISLFILFSILYFIPSNILSSFLPSEIIKYRIGLPLLTLAIAGIYMIPWPVATAMMFSCAGDYMGAYGSFTGQMSCFAITHIMLIYWFINRFRNIAYKPSEHSAANIDKSGEVLDNFRLNKISTFCIAGSVSAILLGFAISFIIPEISGEYLKGGCIVYALLICVMLGTAILQRDWIFGLGAGLFLLSDMILAWNKFVSDVPYQKYLIMVPYYIGQLLLWLRARGDKKS